MTEKDYFGVPMNSSSSLKDYSTDRRKYKKRHILKEKTVDKDGAAMMMGNLVETLLMEPDRFDELFYMSACATTPGPETGMGKFVDALAKYTVAATDLVTGVVTEDFMTMAEKAYIDSEYKIKIEAVIKKFTGTDAEIYYEELVKVRFNDLTVITPNDINNAERIVAELKSNPTTATIVNLESGKRFEVINQIKLIGFEIDGMKMKSMLDKIIIDHTSKTIQIYDLKCTWNVENFYKEYYLYRRAYIQAYVYFKACQALVVSDSGIDPEKSTTSLEGYKVLFPKFIVCDSINYYAPLIYDLCEQDLIDAYYGFEARNYAYPGVKQIISELKWSIADDVWNISQKNYANNGHAKLEY